MIAALAGRRALVTGGSRGIGLAIARRLQDEGAEVTIAGRTQASLDAAATAEGLAAVALDVTDPNRWRSVVTALPPIDILINCAGQAESAPFLRHGADRWERMIAVNLSAVFHACDAVLPGMVERGFGRIVTIASTGGLAPYRYVAGYVAAKHGVIGLTRALALEFADRGLTVNAVCPGFTRTDMYEGAIANLVAKTGRDRAAAERALIAGNPQQRPVEPDEVADAAAWLCSPGAGAVTGQSIVVAGGEVMP